MCDDDGASGTMRDRERERRGEGFKYKDTEACAVLSY